MKIPKSETRKIWKSGSSKVLSLPPDFLELNDLDLSDEVRVRWKDNILEVKPLKPNHSAMGVEEGEDSETEKVEKEPLTL